MGNAKLALDRVPAVAKALEDDPAMIMRLAIEQTHGPEMLKLITDLLSEPLTDNERAWLKLIRGASSNTDPAPARTIARVLKLFLHDTEVDKAGLALADRMVRHHGEQHVSFCVKSYIAGCANAYFVDMAESGYS